MNKQKRIVHWIKKYHEKIIIFVLLFIGIGGILAVQIWLMSLILQVL